MDPFRKDFPSDRVLIMDHCLVIVWRHVEEEDIPDLSRHPLRHPSLLKDDGRYGMQ